MCLLFHCWYFTSVTIAYLSRRDHFIQLILYSDGSIRIPIITLVLFIIKKDPCNNYLFLNILFRAYNLILNKITRSLIVFINSAHWKNDNQILVYYQLVFTFSKLTKETLEQGVKYDPTRWRRSGVFIVNFEHNSHLVLVFVLLTFNM